MRDCQVITYHYLITSDEHKDGNRGQCYVMLSVLNEDLITQIDRQVPEK